MRFNFGAIWLFDCIHHKPPEENKIFFPTFPVKIFVWWGKMDGSIDRTKKAHINLDQLHDGGNSSFDSSAATSSSMQVWYKYLCAYLQHRPMRHINNDYATQYVQMWSWAVITVCSIVYWNVQFMSSSLKAFYNWTQNRPAVQWQPYKHNKTYTSRILYDVIVHTIYTTSWAVLYEASNTVHVS